MQQWIRDEEKDKTIELHRKENRKNRSRTAPAWSSKHIYVCSRQGSRSISKYTKKTAWGRKVPSKRIVTGCQCRLTVKTYPGMQEVLGRYTHEHSHPTGDANARFVRIPAETRLRIAELLRMGVDRARVLREVQGNVHTEDNLDGLRSRPCARSEYVVMPLEVHTIIDMSRFQKEIEAETIRLDAQDGQSTKEWVENLRKRGELMGFKGRMPAAWMLASNGTEVTIDYFLSLLRKTHPNIKPRKFMSDKDWAQLNAIFRRYPESHVLLCWWHVLHAWQQHFSIVHHPELWELLKGWIRITGDAEFSARWDEIKALAPPSVISYLETNWLSDRDVEMWSAKFRRDRNVFELGDTNMLHRRQDFGFEGPDLEVKRRMEVESRALSIGKDAIEKVDSESIYRVQSQSDPSHYYSVDIEAYTCDCLSFPLIDFCKHIGAVQRLFPEVAQEVPVSSLGNVSAAPTSSDSDEDESGDEEDLSQASITEDPRILDLINSLQHLAVRTRLSPPSYFNDSLLVLKHAVDTVLDETSFADVEVLPARKKVAPNQGSDWRSTQQVMGAPVKSKRKPKHTDPYSGGEQSGRKGQPDARQPLLPPTITLPPQPTQPIPPSPQPGPSCSTISFNSMPMAMPPPYNPPHHLPWLDPRLQSSIPLDLNSVGPSVWPQDRNATNLAAADPYAQLYYRSYDSPDPDAIERRPYYR
ncbi:hypothetical protein B0H11DRAFT_1754820 [Mycena galericulata]|nr:hypothetical protein B0H11DRAFT_1754820 [Mycena galericulata]